MIKPICFIGARGGSKGVKKKNTRQIGGKPLIAHTIIMALNSKLFSHVIVSTEDKKIAKIAKKFGAEVPFIRPKNLATDNARMMDVWRHGIDKLRSIGYEFDVMVSLDCTAPFVRSYDVKKSIELLKKKKCNAVFGVYEQHMNPYFNMMEKNSKGFLELSKKSRTPIIRRQDSPEVFQLMGLFTMYADKLLKYDTHMMPKIIPLKIPIETGLMIDTEIEFKFAKLLMENKNLRK